MSHEILTTGQMAEADRLAIKAGTPGYVLMQRAGEAAVKEIVRRFKPRRVLVLCGPGNNGGDGFVIARLLKKRKWRVKAACLVRPQALKGDAAQACADWKEEILSFEEAAPQEGELIIDAVFGTGFKGSLKEPVTRLFRDVEKLGLPVVAVDIPSGVNGDTGAISPHTLSCVLCVTFHRKKLGHVLYPGAGYCGDLVVGDIGIMADGALAALENHPDLWHSRLPVRTPGSHKYDYGHAVIFGAERMTGATRLAAESCARIGAGLTSVAAPPGAGNIYRCVLPPHIIVADEAGLEDERKNAVLIGPGGGGYGELRKKIEESCVYGGKKRYIIDADGLNALAAQKGRRYNVLNHACILTPHEGEFQRLFPDIKKGSKLERAQAAARKAGCVVVLKGPDTVISASNGFSVINANAPENLATAGTGDVLAGMITGLCAQHMDEFWAACAAVWIHSEAARVFGGPGLVAGDLPGLLPGVLQGVDERG